MIWRGVRILPAGLVLSALTAAAGIPHSAGAAVLAPPAAGAPGLSLTAPPTAQAQSVIDLVVRTAPRVAVHLRVQFAGETYHTTQFTGAHGWARFTYSVPFSAQPGTARVTARAVVRGHGLVATKEVQIEPFVPIVKVDHTEVLHQAPAGWVPATALQSGEVVRLAAFYAVLELAGYFAPPCLAGTVRLLRGSDVLVTEPVQCPASQPANSLPYVYADIPLTGAIGTGSLTAQFDLSHDEGMYGTARGQVSIPVSVVP